MAPCDFCHSFWLCPVRFADHKPSLAHGPVSGGSAQGDSVTTSSQTTSTGPRSPEASNGEDLRTAQPDSLHGFEVGGNAFLGEITVDPMPPRPGSGGIRRPLELRLPNHGGRRGSHLALDSPLLALGHRRLPPARLGGNRLRGIPKPAGTMRFLKICSGYSP